MWNTAGKEQLTAALVTGISRECLTDTAYNDALRGRDLEYDTYLYDSIDRSFVRMGSVSAIEALTATGVAAHRAVLRA